ADETWGAGVHSVTGIVRVESGARLTIAPCARVVFQPDAGIDVDGALVAEGTKDEPILFARADGEKPWAHLAARHPGRIVLRHALLTGGGSDGFRHGATLVGRADSALPLKPVLLVEHVQVQGSEG